MPSPFGFQGFPQGMMNPPPPVEEESPLFQAQGMGIVPPPDPTFAPDFAGGNIPSTNNPPWAQQLMGASSSPPESSKNLEGGSALIDASSKSKGKASKWLDTLAPILAGAAAVLGFKKDSAFGDVLMGVGQGFASHLTDEAKAKRDLKAKSDTSTVDLAHKYLAAMPGDVDEEKYPGLAEMGRNLREKLVGGQLSSPKEAQDFILEYTKYKNEIDQLQKDREHQEQLSKAGVPFEAFRGAFGEAGIAPEATGSALMRHYGNLVEDPQNQGRYVDPTTISAREATSRAAANQSAAGQRSLNEIASREKVASSGRAARSADVRFQEGERNKRASERLKSKGSSSSKEYDAAYAKATSYSLQKGKVALPSEAASKGELWKHDYLIGVGKDYKPLTRNIKGKTYYYIGDDQWDTKPVEMTSGLKMTQPPMIEPPMDDEEEDFE